MLESINTENAPAAIGPYSQAIKTKDLIFVSGQLPVDPKTGKFISEDIKSQTLQVIKNIEAILLSQGLNLTNIVKTSVFLIDMNEFKDMNEVYASKFQNSKPARETVQVARLPLNAKIEISCIATIN
jgi:2-iminobutanoate/2-iminopropanoate deaminase